MIRRAALRPLLLTTLCAGATACAPGLSDLEQYVESTRNKYQGSVEPLPLIEPYQSYKYAALDRRDPFTEPQREQAAPPASGPRPDMQRRKEPLEAFPLDSLRMVGTLERQGEVWGLVRDPNGTIHRVKPGNHMGQNYGEIVRITESRIELVELVPDGLGGWMERKAQLSLTEEK
ncbi:MAG: fimbrial protein [Gammaproteobacteria bacterium]|nr:MAG: fimbrial protein [Gammaproteobacteria bacterium]